MSNSDYGKVKLLYLYDYFLKELNPYEDVSASVTELIDYLENMTGHVFERKSVYSDIQKLNEYMKCTGKVKGGGDWIYLEKKKYKVAELKDWISIDEARLIRDAINTTAFTDSGISGKIKELFPSYFKDGKDPAALVERDRKNPVKLTSILNNIRMCIDERCVMRFNYGYKLGKAFVFSEQRRVSPLALDWENNTYYLIAIDNAVYEKNVCRGLPPDSSMRRFRIDRIESVRIAPGERFCDFPSRRKRKEAIDLVLENSLKAYTSTESSLVGISLRYESGMKASSNDKTKPMKEVLRAYNILADNLKVVTIKDDSKIEKGRLSIVVEAADAPTFYAYLFQAGTVPGIRVIPEEGPVRVKYMEYLKKAEEAIGG